MCHKNSQNIYLKLCEWWKKSKNLVCKKNAFKKPTHFHSCFKKWAANCGDNPIQIQGTWRTAHSREVGGGALLFGIALLFGWSISDWITWGVSFKEIKIYAFTLTLLKTLICIGKLPRNGVRRLQGCCNFILCWSLQYFIKNLKLWSEPGQFTCMNWVCPSICRVAKLEACFFLIKSWFFLITKQCVFLKKRPKMPAAKRKK